MIEIEVEDLAWSEALPDVEGVVERAAAAALRRDERWDLTVLLTSDAEIADLNARFRGKPQPTNVLSFPAAPSAAPHLGDIALAYGVCADEAQAQGKRLADHLSHLVVHGVLHLLGSDHADDGEAEEMEGWEREVLATLGVADPYREAAAPHDDHG